jgi:hypothetical protein
MNIGRSRILPDAGRRSTPTPSVSKAVTKSASKKLLAERPEYFVFNGSVGALTLLHPLDANVGETTRLFFGAAQGHGVRLRRWRRR